jgi:hypothetical protein
MEGSEFLIDVVPDADLVIWATAQYLILGFHPHGEEFVGSLAWPCGTFYWI